MNYSGITVNSSNIDYKINKDKPTTLYPTLKLDNDGYPYSDCPIAAIEFEGFSPDKIVNIISKEDSIYENTFDFCMIEELTQNISDSYFPILHYPFQVQGQNLHSFLVTDIKSENSQNGKPLFYQYELLYDMYTDIHINSIKNIYLNNEIVLDTSNFLVQYSYDLLSNNNRYSSTIWRNAKESNITEIHRVRILFSIECFDPTKFYMVEYDKSMFGARSIQKELIELKPIYTTNTDFTINISGLLISNGSLISENTNLLYLIKDPEVRIKPIDIITTNEQSGPQALISNKMASWNLRISTGNFTVSPGLFSSRKDGFFRIRNIYQGGSPNIPITNIIPERIIGNILKIKEAPIYINELVYKHPEYIIEVYDDGDVITEENAGKIGFTVNGFKRTDIKINSIDRQKGYIHTDTNFNETDEIEIYCYMQTDKSLILDQLELNPSLTSTVRFNISQNGFLKTGIGLAIRPYIGNIFSEGIYLYDPTTPESTRQVYFIPPFGENDVTLNWSDYKFISIGEISINKPTKDMLLITDARIEGGGIKDDDVLVEWCKTHLDGNNINEHEWYSHKAAYGGSPLAHSSVIIIHIPESYIDSAMNRWIDYYIKDINKNNNENQISYEEAKQHGVDEFKSYLDQMIRRFISAGSEYILIPTTTELTSPYNSTFNGSNFLDLR